MAEFLVITNNYTPRFAFPYCSWGSHGKNTGVVCHSLLQWTMFCQTLHYDPSILGALHDMAHTFIELCKPLCYDKAVIPEVGWHSGMSRD